MSFVTTQPEALAAAGNCRALARRCALRMRRRQRPTWRPRQPMKYPQFAAHAQIHQAVGTQTATSHEMFVNTLGISSGAYAATEAANGARGRKRDS